MDRFWVHCRFFATYFRSKTSLNNTGLAATTTTTAAADDTQLYCSLTTNDEVTLLQEWRRMERCVEDVRQWLYMNKLKINE
jgi:hypothetical protein